ncbi:hypothetical protein ABPG72_001121 [Tetrahymena utriculariae]
MNLLINIDQDYTNTNSFDNIATQNIVTALKVVPDKQQSLYYRAIPVIEVYPLGQELQESVVPDTALEGSPQQPALH